MQIHPKVQSNKEQRSSLSKLLLPQNLVDLFENYKADQLASNNLSA
jgi:hypothetical protein